MTSVATRHKPGHIVWAKVKGYPWWPAVVGKNQDSNGVMVRFIGDNTHATLTDDKIAHFEEKFGQYSRTKDRKLNECIKSAIRIQTKQGGFAQENSRLLEKFQNKQAMEDEEDSPLALMKTARASSQGGLSPPLPLAENQISVKQIKSSPLSKRLEGNISEIDFFEKERQTSKEQTTDKVSGIRSSSNSAQKRMVYPVEYLLGGESGEEDDDDDSKGSQNERGQSKSGNSKLKRKGRNLTKKNGTRPKSTRHASTAERGEEPPLQKKLREERDDDDNAMEEEKEDTPLAKQDEESVERDKPSEPVKRRKAPRRDDSGSSISARDHSSAQGFTIEGMFQIPPDSVSKTLEDIMISIASIYQKGAAQSASGIFALVDDVLDRASKSLLTPFGSADSSGVLEFCLPRMLVTLRFLLEGVTSNMSQQDKDTEIRTLKRIDSILDAAKGKLIAFFWDNSEFLRLHNMVAIKDRAMAKLGRGKLKTRGQTSGKLAEFENNETPKLAEIAMKKEDESKEAAPVVLRKLRKKPLMIDESPDIEVSASPQDLKREPVKDKIPTLAKSAPIPTDLDADKRRKKASSVLQPVQQPRGKSLQPPELGKRQSSEIFPDKQRSAENSKEIIALPAMRKKICKKLYQVLIDSYPTLDKNESQGIVLTLERFSRDVDPQMGKDYRNLVKNIFGVLRLRGADPNDLQNVEKTWKHLYDAMFSNPNWTKCSGLDGSSVDISDESNSQPLLRGLLDGKETPQIKFPMLEEALPKTILERADMLAANGKGDLSSLPEMRINDDGSE